MAAATRRKSTKRVTENVVEVEVETSSDSSYEVVLVGPGRYVRASLNGGATILKGETVQVDTEEEKDELLDMVYLNKFNQDTPYFISAEEYPAWQKRSVRRSRTGGDLSVGNMRGVSRR